MSPTQTVLSCVLDVVYTGKWISIVRCIPLPGHKTDLYEVMAREPCTTLGEIRWHGPWFRYALFPRAETVWEPQCLREVTRFMEPQTRARRVPSAPGKTLREVFAS
jgi:hypothetical protein